MRGGGAEGDDGNAPVVLLLGLVPGLETSSGADARPGELKYWASARGSFLTSSGWCKVVHKGRSLVRSGHGDCVDGGVKG